MSWKMPRKDSGSPDTIGVRSIAMKGLSEAYKPMPLAIGNYQTKTEIHQAKKRRRNNKVGFSHDIASIKTQQVNSSAIGAQSQQAMSPANSTVETFTVLESKIGEDDK